MNNSFVKQSHTDLSLKPPNCEVKGIKGSVISPHMIKMGFAAPGSHGYTVKELIRSVYGREIPEGQLNDTVCFHVVLRCSGVLQHGKAGRILTLCLVAMLFSCCIWHLAVMESTWSIWRLGDAAWLFQSPVTSVHSLMFPVMFQSNLPLPSLHFSPLIKLG